MTPTEIVIAIRPDGTASMLYQEEFRLNLNGTATLRRASHVEPDGHGKWWADLSPVQGPLLGPFVQRSQALAAEIAWINQHLATIS